MPAAGAARRLIDDLHALDRAYSPGHHGRWSAERRSDLVDAHMRELFAEAHPPAGIALVALGGYGRRELAPASSWGTRCGRRTKRSRSARSGSTR
jgi:UTP:GlnB (protein PII) uridylyltransferase